MNMNLLVTLDSKYIRPLKVMLTSLFMNNPEEHFHIYLMHSRIEDDEIIDIESFTDRYGQKLIEIKIDDDIFIMPCCFSLYKRNVLQTFGL